MNIIVNSHTTLRLSVAPSVKSWGIFFGILSVGIGAAYYSPDEHVLMKMFYMCGCLVLGLTFLDDWEDCVIDQIQKKITLTRRNWFEVLTSHCASSKTLVLDTSSVMGVRVSPATGKNYQVGLLLRNGSIIPMSETTSGPRSEEEAVATCVKRILNLDHVEPFREDLFNDSDDEYDTLTMRSTPRSTPDIETLHGSEYLNFDVFEDDGINQYDNDHRLFNEESDHNPSNTDEENNVEL